MSKKHPKKFWARFLGQISCFLAPTLGYIGVFGVWKAYKKGQKWSKTPKNRDFCKYGCLVLVLVPWVSRIHPWGKKNQKIIFLGFFAHFWPKIRVSQGRRRGDVAVLLGQNGSKIEKKKRFLQIQPGSLPEGRKHIWGPLGPQNSVREPPIRPHGGGYSGGLGAKSGLRWPKKGQNSTKYGQNAVESSILGFGATTSGVSAHWVSRIQFRTSESRKTSFKPQNHDFTYK